MADPQKFWMVLASHGGGRRYIQRGVNVPTKRHETMASAIAEARRQVEIDPSKRCYVLEAVGYVQVADGESPGEFGPVLMRPMAERQEAVLP